MSDITITLCNPQTGQSESIPVANTMTIGEVVEFGKALLGMDGNLIIAKDGKPLASTTQSLAQAGVANGDLLVVMPPAARRPAPAQAPAGGLDFSNLLESTSAPAPAAGGLNFSNLLGASSGNADNPSTVFYAGMNLQDAMDANPHPKAIVKLLQEQVNLFKELNFRNPVLAQKIKGLSYDEAVQVWREYVVKGSIKTSFAISQSLNKEKDFTKRLRENPNDTEAKEYFDKKKKEREVDEQYRQVMQEYPESMGRVLMLYIDAKINEHPIQAFVDSGAQSTIMSKKMARNCGILDLVDTRFAGVAMGVGTGKILGRIHMVQLQIGHIHFPCSVTVMDDATMPMAGGDKDKAKPQDMDFLLGLDMLKRHTCSIDLTQGKLKFRLSPTEYLETPFLHEKDLDQSKGGTKGFDATKSNEELLKAQQKHDKDDSNKMEE
ncbi:unnamed protein product [Cylindrotheca closterium]|uniref:Aspartic peptidase DDI1-type domain-containing protein n=1 Tax=Cylindrotheca closterium TaxID=2856 RepID=A0AAD2CNB4_9STRA|nr:unnamed protein product [Cylindrotheca closterium]